ncbi:MAG: AgmX/PglI C-terminal domain-containing protein [Pseudobdellovibrionaceae bacterium]
MQNLLIEQKGPTGLLKTWKLRSEQKVLTFGHSKHADLRTTVESIKGIQGVFEFKNDKWYYINLDLHTKHSEMGENCIEMVVDKDVEIRMGTTTLSMKLLEGRSPLFSNLEGEVSHSGNDRQPFQLFTVYSGTTLLETTLIPVHKTFVSKFDSAKTKFKPEKVEGWKKTELGHLQISQRTVFLDNNEALKHLSPKQLVDEDGRKSFAFTLSAALLLALLFMLSPKQQTLEDSLNPPPIPMTREVKMEIPKKKKQTMAETAPKETVPQQQAAAPKQAGSGSSKAASMIKSLASGRITSLVGKVAASARSANVVVTSGVTAGSGPTGRALAALGAIGKSGKDWSAEGKGTGVTISTNGKAGGKGTSGLGEIGAGKTGSGGVGLLEDEGEIVGGLDRDIIAQYIKSQLGQILYCYERQLSATPDLYGKVAIKFTISGSGGVETQRIGDSTLKNATVEGCILQRVAKWKFPAPEGGTKVLVTYPFLFKSTN